MSTNTDRRTSIKGRSLLAAAVASILLAACAAEPVKPSGAADVRAKLTRLQGEQTLANRAPAALADAEMAVRAAEEPQTDPQVGAHLVYLADRRIDIARAQAETRYLEEQRAALDAQRQGARLDARTREADAATADAADARADAAAQKAAADQARSNSDAANAAAARSEQQSAELQRQIQELDARVTERGLVLTLGDVLFETGKADLRGGTTGHLDKLVTFLGQYTDRSVMIEGYTDNVGSDSYNQGLSERRAESVRTYLNQHGVDASRLAASGRGMSNPIADNGSATGRQQNRRVEVIVSNPATASR